MTEEENRRVGRCIFDLITFAMEAKIPEHEFLAAITEILAIKLASMPKRERRKLLEEIGEIVEGYAEGVNKLPADKKEILRRCGWEFDEG